MATTTTLSHEDLQALHRAALDVWDYIGYDCLTAVREAAETPRQRANPTLTRAAVLEVVVDAGRLEDEVRRHCAEPQRARLLAYLQTTPYDRLLATLRPAFGFARYGL